MSERRKMLLRIITNDFVAGIVYEKRGIHLWVPVRAAPVLVWALQHRTSKQMGQFLKGPGKRAGWEWEWVI